MEVELFVSRARTAGWAAFGVLFGALLAWKLGTVAMWVGIVLMTVGGFRIWEVVQSFIHPPGTIIVTDSQVTLPRGLSLGKPLEVAPSDVTAVYFLRRSVPWNRSAPVLVVELGAQAIAYPRDWFASEADQRHVVHALMRGIAEEPTKASSNVPRIDGDATLHMIAGLVILIAGVVGALATRGSNVFPLFVVPIVAGTIVAWRGFSRW
ncbi:MAG: hypothetical protein SFX73_05555 [Kofleriaceae bacterium]|nr:hypothetical protein [Kofleriaceae bacterium]